MIPKGSECCYEKHIISRTFCSFCVVSYPDKKGGDQQYVYQIDPDYRRSGYEARNGLVGVIYENKYTRAE